MISVKSSGSFKKTNAFLEKMRSKRIFSALERYGEMGVKALKDATPIDSKLTAESWSYTVRRKGAFYSITWRNSNVVDGVPVIILLQYGHGTGTGGWVEGEDLINPVIRPLFDKIAEDVWKEVKNA